MSSRNGPRWLERINCGCKINLRLKVTARRKDKLHELSSCFLFLEHPGDELVVESSAGGLSLISPGYPELAGKNNLLWKAAEAYAAAAGIAPQWQITLDKQVPVAAGLGGGSADAGGLLALLNSRYSALSESDLNRLAFSLGADVPFFLNRRAAWVTGAGENIEFLPELPEIPQILIVNPGFPVSAAWAYTHMAPALIGADLPEFKAELIAGRITDWQSFCRNDLAPALWKKFPLLGSIRDSLRDSGALAVQVSGSGSSLFALFDRNDLQPAARQLRRRFAGENKFRIFAGGKEF